MSLLVNGRDGNINVSVVTPSGTKEIGLPRKDFLDSVEKEIGSYQVGVITRHIEGKKVLIYHADSFFQDDPITAQSVESTKTNAIESLRGNIVIAGIGLQGEPKSLSKKQQTFIRESYYLGEGNVYYRILPRSHFGPEGRRQKGTVFVPASQLPVKTK